jgi:hypothetical protein
MTHGDGWGRSDPALEPAGRVEPPPGAGSAAGRPRGIGVVAAILAAAVVVALGVGTGVGLLLRKSGATASTTAAATPPGNPSPIAAPGPFTGDLRTVLLAAPNDSMPPTTPLSPDGNLSLDQVAAMYANPAEIRQLLTGLSFQAAAVAEWIEVDNPYVRIILYRFGSDTGAFKFAIEQQTGYSGYATQPPVSGIDDSALLTQSTPDSKGFVFSVVIASKANIAMLVIDGQLTTVNTSAVSKVAQQQYQLLP